ncbi:OmpA family protein [Arcicella rosea]|uniref:Outer membrane protein OmpA-like peptidoglycan-associated protein n=1 Tax=Arcicella rosea TaxID=502909 RepID=A0A841EU14_9BACT|nr:OmpA family protein [Arcicella rosea]MBB6004553.1 outer membrane protein OmpA-like peptidoglycan-associated protein [Arcicella rosea]
MKSKSLAILLLLYSFSFRITAQQVFWASKVLEFSSENIVPFQSSANKANQILGKPNVLPQFVRSGLAWQPAFKTLDSQEFIKVSFDTTIAIQQISIAQNFGEATIEKVIAFDSLIQTHVLFQQIDSLQAPEKGEMFNIILSEKTSFKVFGIGVFISKRKHNEQIQLDAIGISTLENPVQININVAKDAPIAVIRENLGKGVNSRHQEFAPVISSDGNTLYFARNYVSFFGKEKDQDVWLSKLNESKEWTKAKNIGLPINTKDKNAVFAISTDGTEMLLMNKYHKNGRLSSGISRSFKNGGNWTFPEEVKIDNYYNQSQNAEFTLSVDGNIMIMSIQRKNTVGKRDLYVSFKKSNSTWTEPKSLGNIVNSIEHEMTPFLAADTKTLYFSTRGFPGFGDNDVFKSQRLDDTWTNWTEPENLGEAINTPYWDGYFTLPASGEFAYVCSYNGNNKEDIYKLTLPKKAQPEPVAIISGNVLTSTDKQTIASTIMMIPRNASLKSEKKTYEPANGNFKFILPLHETVDFVAVARGYLGISETIDLTNVKSYREININLYLLPLEIGNKGILNSLTFQQGDAKLQASAMKDLDRIIQAMNEFPDLEILFEGHTDNQGDFQLNLQLSEDRVNAVKKYITSKGITPNRITTKGWGQTRPLASNATEERRRLNRRVEFTITKK